MSAYVPTVGLQACISFKKTIKKKKKANLDCDYYVTHSSQAQS